MHCGGAGGAGRGIVAVALVFGYSGGVFVSPLWQIGWTQCAWVVCDEGVGVVKSRDAGLRASDDRTPEIESSNA
jgi:hypothetical protein